jgi:hypothetical protein
VRNTKCILIACLAILQLASVVRFAAAVPIAHGRFTSLNDPEFSIPGARLDFSATAVNDGDATGWFRICVIKVDPALTKYYRVGFDETRDQEAIHCSATLPKDPGETITFESNKFRMLSVPSMTFWILLTVQQQAPISNSDGSDITNLSIDDLRDLVLMNLYAQT